MKPPLWLAAVGLVMSVGAFGALGVLLARTLYLPALPAVPYPEYALPAAVAVALLLSALVGFACWVSTRGATAIQAAFALQPRRDTPGLTRCPTCGEQIGSRP